MNMILFNRKTTILAVAIFFFGVSFVHADTLDVVVVNLMYDSFAQKFEIVDVEQKVLDELDYDVSSSGAYRLSLKNQNTELAYNNFDLPDMANVEFFGNSRSEVIDSKLSTAYMSIVLPIKENLGLESELQVIDNGAQQIVESKKLSQVPYQTSSFKSFGLLYESDLVFPDFENIEDGGVNNYRSLILFPLGGLVLILILYFVYKHFRKPTNLMPPGEKIG